MAVYRRQMLFAQWRPRILVLLFAFAMYPVAATPWRSTRPYEYGFPFGTGVPFGLGASANNRGVGALRPELAGVEMAGVEMAVPAPEVSAPVILNEESEAPPLPVGNGLVKLRGAGYATTTNVAIAVSFVDGWVIEPGAKFSFDDAARTWDYHEDPRYLPGPATSPRGVITMRGGGVCWLSTAIWRAALAAGLRTDFRENHYGYVDALGGGLDATNTLVIRNDAPVPVTLRAWSDQEEVYVALYADGDLDRTATVRGPERLGTGRYVAYQDITWDDGRQTTSEFLSRYNW